MDSMIMAASALAPMTRQRLLASILGRKAQRMGKKRMRFNRTPTMAGVSWMGARANPIPMSSARRERMIQGIVGVLYQPLWVGGFCCGLGSFVGVVIG